MTKKSGSGIDGWEPAELVAALEEVDGDLEELARRIAPEDEPLSVIMRAEFVIEQSDKNKLKWSLLINARNQARFKMAQQKVFAKIASWEQPKDENGKELPLSANTMLALARFWCGAESTHQTTRARKEANAATANGDQSELEDLFDGLTEDG